MFTHITIGTNDLEAARAFYDDVLEPLGYKRLFDLETQSGYGAAAPQFMVVKPINGQPATGGNGVTIGLVAPSRAAVNEFHRRALARKAKDEGAPGPRPGLPNLYSAYIRDPVGNKLVAVCMKPE
jgi:catechol 2,3-dioxygenase-like lactoylglutathione lyase family enzyme